MDSASCQYCHHNESLPTNSPTHDDVCRLYYNVTAERTTASGLLVAISLICLLLKQSLENLSSGFLTKEDASHAVRPQNMAQSLKF